MSSPDGECITFREFFRNAFDIATTEPYASRFKEFSKTGDKEKMIQVLLDAPYIGDTKVNESFKGKDDRKAAELYDKFRKELADDTDKHEESESRACNTLIEALFTASASSRLFLDALLDCAKYWYNLKAFARCLKYCDCMLALPTSFFDKTAPNLDYFRKCKEECAALKRKCLESLDVGISERKKCHGKCNRNRIDSYRKTGMEKYIVTTPVVDGKQHRYLESCSDAVALNFDEEKGRHLVATRNIKAGSVLIVDQPFSFSTDAEALDRNCLHCHNTLKTVEAVKIPCHHCQAVAYCSEKCREESWHSYHRYECRIFNFFFETDPMQQRRQSSHLLLAYRTTILQAIIQNKENAPAENYEVPVFNDDFLRWHTSNVDAKIKENNNTEDVKEKKCSRLGLTENYSPHDYQTVLELETHCAGTEPTINLIRTIEAIFLAKCFIFILSKMDSVCGKGTSVLLAVAMLHHLQAINCNAYEIVENVRDKSSHVWEPRNVGGAIYPTVSLVNHSCYPNIVRHSYPGGTVVVRATRFISKGSEVLDCYGPHFLSEGRLTRREYLWKKYRFLCACQACTENWQTPLPETINYKCRACSAIIDISVSNKKEIQKVPNRQCPQCRGKIDSKKVINQLQKSVDKRINAVTKMYEGNYEDSLPLLLEHIHFIEKFVAAPNIEVIKTQQCIIQCYNYFGCISQ